MPPAVRPNLTLLLVALGLLGCSTESPDGYFGTTERPHRDSATLYLNNHDEPESLDPGLAGDRISATLLAELFEGLTVLHPESLQPMAGVATRWAKTADNCFFRFSLRPEARWSDGRSVTAADFAYAWQRVLRPETGARMATLLYRLKNGRLFHQGKLHVLRREQALRRAPDAEPEAGPPLAKGTAVRVWLRTPVEIATAIAPVAAPPEGVAVLRFRAAGPDGIDERLVLEPSGATLTAARDGGLRGQRAEVLGAGAEVRCNGQPDRWYRVAVGTERGYLPGCTLAPERATAPWALVELYDDLPRWQKPATRARLEPHQATVGFVPTSALALDPGLLGVRAASERTLEVELAEPTPYFPELVSYPAFFPVRRDLIERFAAAGRPDRWTQPEAIVVNGPYTLESWWFRYQITMKRNPHYYDRDKLAIHRIVWLEVSDSYATMNLYKAAEMDYIGANAALPAAYMHKLARKKDFRRAKVLATTWYDLNVSRAPLGDRRVRQALNLAIDKPQLIDAVTRSGQQPATHFVPDYTGSGYAAQVKLARQAGTDPFAGPEHAFAPERARALLGEAGYPVVREGDRLRAKDMPALEILYGTGPGHHKTAVAIGDMWRRHLGVTVSLRRAEWKVMLQSLRQGRYQIAPVVWRGDYNHPHSWLGTFLSYSDNNWTGWRNAELDELLERAAATADPAQSMILYRRAEALAVAEMPRIPLYFNTKSTLIKPYLKGFFPNTMNVHLVRFMWIDPSWSSHPDNAPAYCPQPLPRPEILPSSPRLFAPSP